MLERQLRKVEGTLITAEYQLETLQNAVSNTVMYANMKYVTRTLKAAQHAQHRTCYYHTVNYRCFNYCQ